VNWRFCIIKKGIKRKNFYEFCMNLAAVLYFYGNLSIKMDKIGTKNHGV
jgi:hypothetical protein